MYVIFVAGMALWIVYGYYLRSAPMMLANRITVALASVILICKIGNVRRDAHR